ncbi:MAG: sulfotransferase family 2 domain-containing protein [Pseudomonadota bacterium]
MIISHKYKFIFIKTRKTAGTSMELAIGPMCGADDVVTYLGGHDDIKEAVGWSGAQHHKIPVTRWTPRDVAKIPLQGKLPDFHSHSPASFVRDHIDPEVWNSYYKICFERHPLDRIVSQYFWNTRETGLTVDQYLDQAEDWRLSNWDMYAWRGRVIVDHVARFENIQEELDAFADKVGLPDRIELPRAKGEHRPKKKTTPQDVLSSEQIERIAITCAREARAFGYTI